MSGAEPSIVSSQQGAVRRITLNRPEVLNAIDSEMHACLLGEIREAMSDSEVRVVVLSGAGRAFCSGADLKSQPAAGVGAGLGSTGTLQDAPADVVNNRARVHDWLEIWGAPKPIIAQVHGYCIGIANELVACCDLVVCAPSAKFGMPEAREFALPPTLGFWPMRCGIAVAKELLYTGRFVEGSEAVSLGLANRVVESEDELEAQVDGLAEQIAEVPAARLAMIKLAVNSWAESSGLREASYRGAEHHALYHQASRFAERVADIAED